MELNKLNQPVGDDVSFNAGNTKRLTKTKSFKNLQNSMPDCGESSLRIRIKWAYFFISRLYDASQTDLLNILTHNSSL
jgi:hypothetical protein